MKPCSTGRPSPKAARFILAGLLPAGLWHSPDPAFGLRLSAEAGERLTNLMPESNSSGFVVALVLNGNEIIEAGFGLRDVETRRQLSVIDVRRWLYRENDRGSGAHRHRGRGTRHCAAGR